MIDLHDFVTGPFFLHKQNMSEDKTEEKKDKKPKKVDKDKFYSNLIKRIGNRPSVVAQILKRKRQ